MPAGRERRRARGDLPRLAEQQHDLRVGPAHPLDASLRPRRRRPGRRQLDGSHRRLARRRNRRRRARGGHSAERYSGLDGHLHQRRLVRVELRGMDRGELWRRRWPRPHGGRNVDADLLHGVPRDEPALLPRAVNPDQPRGRDRNRSRPWDFVTGAFRRRSSQYGGMASTRMGVAGRRNRGSADGRVRLWTRGRHGAGEPNAGGARATSGGVGWVHGPSSQRGGRGGRVVRRLQNVSKTGVDSRGRQGTLGQSKGQRVGRGVERQSRKSRAISQLTRPCEKGSIPATSTISCRKSMSFN